MNIIAVEDEQISRKGLVKILSEVFSNDSIFAFESADEAVRYFKKNPCDLAFLDIRINETSGIDVGILLKHYHPEARLIFTTGYSDYAVDAFSIHADGYILKPVTKEKIVKEKEHLFGESKDALPDKNTKTSTMPAEITDKLPDTEEHNPLRIQTFGNFEVFLNERPMSFQYRKTKELLAYLIDRRGTLCTDGELISVLWEDGSLGHRSYLRTLKKDLKDSFPEDLFEKTFIKEKGGIGVIPQSVHCDYFDLINGKRDGSIAYTGEYMSQYSWAEMTHQFLDRVILGQYRDSE